MTPEKKRWGGGWDWLDYPTMLFYFFSYTLMKTPQQKIKEIMVNMESREDEKRFLWSWHSAYHYAWDDSRYRYDWLLKSADWRKQYDTDQDAWYFWIRVNLKLMMTVTYAEWDLTIVMAKGKEEMIDELEKMDKFYWKAPPAMISYDWKWNKTEHYDPRPSYA